MSPTRVSGSWRGAGWPPASCVKTSPDSQSGPATSLVPDREVRARVDRRFAFAIRDWKAAAARDRAQIAPGSLDGVHHGVPYAAEVLEVSARADVHVQADQVEPVALDARQSFAQ